MSTAIAIRDEQPMVKPPEASLGSLLFTNPDELVSGASRVATTLARIIEEKKLYRMIGGKKYVFCDGWCTLGALIGIVPVEDWSRRLANEEGYESRVKLVRTRDGMEIGGASAECTYDEQNWEKRDSFALKSMSLTRATGKAFRLGFSWVMVLAGYAPTPAEEMPREPVSPTQRNAGEANAPKAAPTANGKAKTSPAPSQPKNNLAPAHAPKSDWPVGHGFVQSVTFGTTRPNKETGKGGGQAYAKVLQEGNTLFCYDDHQLTLADGEIVSVFKLLENAEDSMCHFTVESKGERHKIVGATQIAEHSWLEDGTPCIQREAASPRADGQEEMAY